MYSTPNLATRFARNTRVMRGDQPLSEDQMRAAAPSIFAEGKHASRSERYTYIPTIDVLRGLRKEGFEPFMVAQGASRVFARRPASPRGALTSDTIAYFQRHYLGPDQLTDWRASPLRATTAPVTSSAHCCAANRAPNGIAVENRSAYCARRSTN